MPPQIPPLDEQEFDQPFSETGRDLGAGNNISFYFMNSQFFEPRSNNIAVYTKAQGEPNGMQMLNDRAVFEAELRKHHDGLQFVVAAEPQGDGQPWLIQRQNIVVDSDTRRPETAVEGNWYTQGSRILMAPSLLDVVQSRLLTVSTRMQRMAELAQNMSHWSPATGHTYLPPTYDVPKQASTASRAGSPVLAPTDPDAPSQSQSQSQSQPQPSLDPTTAAAHFSDDLFMRSLNLTHAYGNEYMDENPLQGEPGAFVFANSRSHVDARNKADEHASQLSQQTVPADSQLPSVAPSVVATPRTVATPRAVATPLALDAPSRKGSVAGLPKDKEEKRKRRKSRGLASPTTPSVA